MDRKYMRQTLITPFIVMSLLVFILIGLLFTVHPLMAALAGVIVIFIVVITGLMLKKSLIRSELYLDNIAVKVSRGNKIAINEIPIGMILLDESDKVEWYNQFIREKIDRPILSDSINEIFPNLLNQLKIDGVVEVHAQYKETKFKVRYAADTHMLYFLDETERVETFEVFEKSKPVVGMLFLDNYDEITQNMSDANRTEMNSMMTNEINQWAAENHIYVKRFSSDQFVIFLNNRILAELESTKFNLLDRIREKSREKKTHLTLSVGIGEGTDDLITLGELAQSSLDLALGRGGDQVAIKNTAGGVRFFGGKTNPMEKRTRVRARVISHALRDILIEGDNVIIMGHKRPDMDAIGAAIGVARFARMNNLNAYIVLNSYDIDETLSRVMLEIEEKPELKEVFITSDEAWSLMTNRTTLVVVDTHKPDMVIDENILNKASRKVVIDHHRRGEDFISSPLLIYMEPYASSTAELVTELLEYQPEEHKLTRLESTVMLAGIIVDTRNFTLRTGSRTFDAASYLRSHGADTILCQHFLKDNMETYLQRSDLIKTVQLGTDGIAVAHGDEQTIYDPVTIAQTADELLSINGVEASFVVARRADDIVGISARSLGEINVQLVMEALGGGGHLSNAATQLKGISIETALLDLEDAIAEQFRRSEE
ncbi:DHH family phosphoesterase [Macrococcus hajekii]|uniref:Cyclic-di-AMP phosphodiesterase n=1 Tax=Macrococcus hajekii TaxID=198482 RepID=A0A4R6BKC5_9STAP|nr:DHH family phosphoesterase [Macrococcus hajekii]TDM02031.1 DHH family phosphoesterase [Macrococcus hajekii]GGB09504.1 DHH family phosphoesterase [Macrococcus hajekii]